MSGTSMATPCVAGCAAIVSSGISGVDASVRAAQTVRICKGAVRQADGYTGLCKQNGQIDLGLVGDASGYAPVIESAQAAAGTVTVKGAYFGTEKGALSVGGAEAQVLSWSDSSITAAWPQDVASGLVAVSVTSAAGSESHRAFILEAPETASASAALYEHELAPMSLKDDGLSIMNAPQAMAATDDGVLYAVAADDDDGGRQDATAKYLLRSDDQGASWSHLALPRALKCVSLAVGDGGVFVLGATPADNPTGFDAWYLYRMDISKGTFESLRSYEDGDSEMDSAGSIAYANGCLYYADYGIDSEGDGPSHVRLRSFDEDYNLVGSFLLKHDYNPNGFYDAPMLSAMGSSIYACTLSSIHANNDEGQQRGLERVDVAANGSLTCTDLSSAIYGLGSDCSNEDICIAASGQGVFLIGDGLEPLLPDGAARTDTLLLKEGAKAFEAYSRTLSYAPVYRSAAVVCQGRLYAYGASKYEVTTVFGRATDLAAESAPDPAPDPDPTPKAVPAVDESVVAGSYVYTVRSSSTVSVRLSAAGRKSLVRAKIPATVKLGGKAFKVASIDAEGFASAKRLASVTIGSNVKRIRANAFYKCEKLASVKGGASVTGIGTRAFEGCAKLKTFKIGSKKLSSIGSAAFKDCKKLKKLSITATTKLTKKGVEGSLIGSRVKTVDVKNAKKTTYKKCFTKKNCGRKVKLG